MFHPMMLWALGSRLQRRTILACSILLAVLACAALPSVSDASRKFRGKGFATIVPTNWKTGKGKQGTTRVYGAASPGTRPNVAPNAMQLGISVIPVTDMERQLGRKLPSTLEQLLGLVLQSTQQQNSQLTAPVRSSTLGGRPAASGAVQSSTPDGVTVLQSETVSVYRGQVYLVAFTLDVNLQYQGLPILARAHRHWRWR
jgi:hypothetical protein